MGTQQNVGVDENQGLQTAIGVYRLAAYRFIGQIRQIRMSRPLAPGCKSANPLLRRQFVRRAGCHSRAAPCRDLLAHQVPYISRDIQPLRLCLFKQTSLDIRRQFNRDSHSSRCSLSQCCQAQGYVFSIAPLNLLADGCVLEIQRQMLDEVQNNRGKNYSGEAPRSVTLFVPDYMQ